MWRLEGDSNLRHSGCKAPNLALRHHTAQWSSSKYYPSAGCLTSLHVSAFHPCQKDENIFAYEPLLNDYTTPSGFHTTPRSYNRFNRNLGTYRVPLKSQAQ